VLRPRVIPVLLLLHAGLVKTIRFKDPTYLGDPVNVVRIFNDKEVDELVLLDITATVEGRRPQAALIGEIAGECFMPLGYGGGIQTVEDIATILGLGVEKAIVNSAAVETPTLVESAASAFGSSTIVVSIDVKRDMLRRPRVFIHGGRKNTGLDPVAFAKQAQEMGAGELILNSIDRDGTMSGYDLELIRQVMAAVTIPVVACGGAGTVADLAAGVISGGASAVAAGSLFVFHGRHRAVLINFPGPRDLDRAFRGGTN
jgi:imidazole glycerol-phosphate synthase subunit HisF